MEFNYQFKKGIQDLKKTSLSKDEKEGMLAHVTQYAAENPVSIANKESIFSSLFAQLQQYRSAYTLALAAVVILIGGNISYAAAQSLPGDLLYPIKIHVNEKIQGALKITPKASAQWEEKKIEKRLEEVNVLVEKGKFDAKKREQVEKEVKKNVETIRKQKNPEKNNLSEKVDGKLKKINETEKLKKFEKIDQQQEVKHLEEKIKSELKKEVKLFEKQGRQK